MKKGKIDKYLNSLVLIFCIVIVTLLLATSLSQALTARQIAQNAFPSIVLLVMEDANGQPVSLGSGFFVLDDVVATNIHVIKSAARGYVKIVGQKTKYEIAGLVFADYRRDLALLKITGVKASPLILGDINQVAVGDEVYAIGNPQGLEGTFSQGIVSGIRQIGSDMLFQITAPISPGSSGGPVLNTQGKVIGVAVATFSGGQNLNFAIPASYLAPLLRSVFTLARVVVPLSAEATTKQKKSIIDDLGGRSVEGVIGENLVWTYGGASGPYSFSFRNQLREPVKDIYCFVVFYDHSGNPIDVDVVYYRDVVPAGLAKRVKSRVDGSVQKLTYKVEFRILDFKIVE
ncbi:MAG: serine protease [Candidatus Atribacteria bacterium]